MSMFFNKNNLINFSALRNYVENNFDIKENEFRDFYIKVFFIKLFKIVLG